MAMPIMEKFATTLDLEIIAIDIKNYISKAKSWLVSQYLDLVKTDYSSIQYGLDLDSTSQTYRNGFVCVCVSHGLNALCPTSIIP